MQHQNMLNAAATFTHQQRRTKPIEKKSSLLNTGTAFSEHGTYTHQ
jgi:hypothetical protein